MELYERLPSVASFPLSDTLTVNRIYLAHSHNLMTFLARLQEDLVTLCAFFPILLMVFHEKLLVHFAL